MSVKFSPQKMTAPLVLRVPMLLHRLFALGALELQITSYVLVEMEGMG